MQRPFLSTFDDCLESWRKFISEKRAFSRKCKSWFSECPYVFTRKITEFIFLMNSARPFLREKIFKAIFGRLFPLKNWILQKCRWFYHGYFINKRIVMNGKLGHFSKRTALNGKQIPNCARHVDTNEALPCTQSKKSIFYCTRLDVVVVKMKCLGPC